jgi:hypothetical protein
MVNVLFLLQAGLLSNLLLIFSACCRWENARGLYSLDEDGLLSKGQYKDLYFRLCLTFNLILENEWGMPPEDAANFEKNYENDWHHDSKGTFYS